MGLLIAVLAFVFVIGLCIGSFLNVVILRTLSEESIVFPASKCPKCQHPLKWWHNIPVLSYIFLRGKCAFCKEHISIQYPIVELLTGIIFTLLFIKFGITYMTLFTWIIAAIMIVIAGTDVKEKVVFDAHTYALMFLGLIYAILVTVIPAVQMYNAGTPIEISKEFLLNNQITISILGLIAGVVIMEICARAGYLVAGTRAFGEGDSYIAAGLGAIFGWRTLITILAMGVVIQVILFLPIFIKGLVKNKEFITLASFIAFVLYAGIFYALQYYKVISLDALGTYTMCAVILAILGIFTCIMIFKGLRENPDNRTYMPFGPAMVAAALIALIL